MTSNQLLEWVANPNETPEDRQVRIAKWFEDEVGLIHPLNISRDVHTQADIDESQSAWITWRKAKSEAAYFEVQRLIAVELSNK